MYPLMQRAILVTLALTPHISIVHGRGGRICPIPECDTCLDVSQALTPGIGFHLGLTAGTAAFSHLDGQFENIVSIPGSSEYIALMRDLTSHPDRLSPPPLDTAAQRAEYLWKILKRRTNLLMGRPGTSHAGTLSAMLSSLRSETKSLVPSLSAVNVGIAIANAALASHEEINDALNYAGMKPLDEFQVADGELNAAYGAYGFGLCPSYRDPYKCEEEENAFDRDDSVLHLDYTGTTLAANTAMLSTARSTYAKPKFASWDLGRDTATEKWGTEDDYWNAVRAAISDLTTEAAARRPFSQLLLTGERVDDPKFQEVLGDELRGPAFTDQMSTSKRPVNFKFAVAQGAAEFQRRRQQGWVNCVQPKGCPPIPGYGEAGNEMVEQAAEL